jgi:alginate O-acetyltransferase complex protein AlgI
MAIGLGRLFGFHFHENFNYPYIAKSATEFWRRWHISLGSFFRDYVYIPLGGNKKFGIRNLFIVWFLTGLWHGASWNFILWGLYFGVLIWIERLFLMKVLAAAGRIFSHMYLLIVAVIGWGLFYFDNMSSLQQFFSMLFGQSTQGHWNVKLEVVLQENMFWLVLAIILCMPVYKYVNRMFKKFLTKRNVNWIWFLSTGFNYALLLLATAMLAGKSYNPFIYFRF